MMIISNFERASIEISFSHYVFEIFGCPRVANSVAFGTRWPKFERFHIFITSPLFISTKQPRINEHIDV